MIKQLFSITLVVAFSFVLAPFEANAQGNFRLNFNSNPSENRFSYTTVMPAEFAISPGGTVSSGGRVEFSTFNDLVTDVVGQWAVVDSAGNVATFDVATIVESDFPTIEFSSPLDGDRYLSGTIVPVQFDSMGIVNIWGTFFDPSMIFVEQLSNEIQGTLEEDVLEAPAILDAFTFRSYNSFISNVDTSQVSFGIDIANTFQRLATEVEVTFYVNSILGDVNRDGDVNLLDIAPFTDLIISGDYQFEADISGDGVVNLLDVAPFQKLLGN